ncbi:unnamed protein product [Bursaphelenchus okinawaensis]|uniref:Periphilin-1 C-terminal domain-containing protein n=1 Tax=Bursaphelenchus okinawaensis TaxID=465554 RepID=A0A811LLG4_9BILA|nr:unnamed protein product [Bursaphelenchus okinawaensis]CAG9124570.1 unnamed protein product [Bursaphelenchus okinawaensis]
MPYYDRQNYRDGYRRNGNRGKFRDDRVNERDVPESKHALFFRGLRADITGDKLRDHFQDEIGPCIIDFYKATGDKLFVAVRFDSKEDAAKCYDKYFEGRLFGCDLEVTWYRDIRRYVAHIKERGERSNDVRRRDTHRRSRSRRNSKSDSESEDDEPKRRRRESSSSSSSSESTHNSSHVDSHKSSQPTSQAISPAKKVEAQSTAEVMEISDNEEANSKSDDNWELKPENYGISQNLVFNIFEEILEDDILILNCRTSNEKERGSSQKLKFAEDNGKTQATTRLPGSKFQISKSNLSTPSSTLYTSALKAHTLNSKTYTSASNTYTPGIRSKKDNGKLPEHSKFQNFHQEYSAPGYQYPGATGFRASEGPQQPYSPFNARPYFDTVHEADDYGRFLLNNTRFGGSPLASAGYVNAPQSPVYYHQPSPNDVYGDEHPNAGDYGNRSSRSGGYGNPPLQTYGAPPSLPYGYDLSSPPPYAYAANSSLDAYNNMRLRPDALANTGTRNKASLPDFLKPSPVRDLSKPPLNKDSSKPPLSPESSESPPFDITKLEPFGCEYPKSKPFGNGFKNLNSIQNDFAPTQPFGFQTSNVGGDAFISNSNEAGTFAAAMSDQSGTYGQSESNRPDYNQVAGLAHKVREIKAIYEYHENDGAFHGRRYPYTVHDRYTNWGPKTVSYNDGMGRITDISWDDMWRKSLKAVDEYHQKCPFKFGKKEENGEVDSKANGDDTKASPEEDGSHSHGEDSATSDVDDSHDYMLPSNSKDYRIEVYVSNDYDKMLTKKAETCFCLKPKKDFYRELNTENERLVEATKQAKGERRAKNMERKKQAKGERKAKRIEEKTHDKEERRTKIIEEKTESKKPPLDEPVEKKPSLDKPAEKKGWAAVFEQTKQLCGRPKDSTSSEYGNERRKDDSDESDDVFVESDNEADDEGGNEVGKADYAFWETDDSECQGTYYFENREEDDEYEDEEEDSNGYDDQEYDNEYEDEEEGGNEYELEVVTESEDEEEVVTESEDEEDVITESEEEEELIIESESEEQGHEYEDQEEYDYEEEEEENEVECQESDEEGNEYEDEYNECEEEQEFDDENTEYEDQENYEEAENATEDQDVEKDESEDDKDEQSIASGDEDRYEEECELNNDKKKHSQNASNETDKESVEEKKKEDECDSQSEYFSLRQSDQSGNGGEKTTICFTDAGMSDMDEEQMSKYIRTIKIKGVDGKKGQNSEVEKPVEPEREVRPSPEHKVIKQIAVERCPSVLDDRPMTDTMALIRRQTVQELKYEPPKESSSNGLQLSSLASKQDELIKSKLSKLPDVFRSKAELKKKELEASYRNDCQTFGLVAKKLLNKNSELEKPMKLAMLEVLKDLENGVNQNLLDYVEELEILL